MAENRTWYQNHLINNHGYMEGHAMAIPAEKRREEHSNDHKLAEWGHQHPAFVQELMDV